MTTLFVCKAALLAIAFLYYGWRHWREWRIFTIRRKRERIAFMLWVAAKQQEAEGMA